MHHRVLVGASVATILGACGTLPISPGSLETPGGPQRQPGPSAGPESVDAMWHLMAAPAPMRRVVPVGVTASSTYRGFIADRALDGDPSTRWASGGERPPTEALTMRFARMVEFGRLRIRTGALPEGITFKADASNDGLTWEPISGRLKNTTSGMEAKDLFGRGRMLRLRFFNSDTAPIERFSVYEVQVDERTDGRPPGMQLPTSQPAPRPSSEGLTQYYPDWHPLPPRDVYLDGTPFNRRLRFDTALSNLGPGHLQIRNRVIGGRHVAVQDILDSSNRVIYTKEVSRFVYEATHGHNHVDDIARYELRQGGPGGEVLRTATKVSFCVEDSFRYRYNTRETSRYRDCTPAMMGITKDYADLYSANLPGQEFDVTDVPAGEYYMVITTDPDHKFLDYSRDDNVAWMRIYLDPAEGTFENRGTSP